MPRTGLSLAEARRVALAAQGFAAARPARPGARHLLATVRRLGLLQFDSVGVLVPAHYQPLFSRLGPYDRSLLDDLTYRRRLLTEQWAHEASIVPVETWPLLRHRMETHRLRPHGFERELARHPDYAGQVLEAVRARGPLAAEDLAASGRRRAPAPAVDWYGTFPRATLEAFFGRGELAVAGRRRNLARQYDLAERVIPAGIAGAAGHARRGAAGPAASGRPGPTASAPCATWPTTSACAPPRPGPGSTSCARPGCCAWCASRAGANRRCSTPGRSCRGASRRPPCSPPSTRWSGSGRGRCASSASTTGWRSTRRRPGGAGATTSSPSCSATGWWRGSTCAPTARRGRLLVLAAHLEPGQLAGEVTGPLAAELGQLAAWLGLGEVRVARRGRLAAALAAEVRSR